MRLMVELRRYSALGLLVERVVLGSRIAGALGWAYRQVVRGDKIENEQGKGRRRACRGDRKRRRRRQDGSDLKVQTTFNSEKKNTILIEAKRPPTLLYYCK